jgi:TrmH family RNA methyltransferase
VLVVAEDCLARPGVAALAARFPRETLVVPAPLFAELATLPAGVGILAAIAAPVPAPAAAADFCQLLDDVQDPGNVGPMLRSAAAAGVAQVLLSPLRARVVAQVRARGAGRALPSRAPRG